MNNPASDGNLSLFANNNSIFVKMADGTALHVTDTGKGKPVVFIHGWLVSNAIFQYQYNYLPTQGYRVIGISLRGHGESDRPPGSYDYDTFADDIKSILESLQIEDATLCGFSMGGAVVLHYVVRHRAAHVNKLVLIGAAAPSFVKRDDYPYGILPEEIDGLSQVIENSPEMVYELAGKTMGSSATAFPGAVYDDLQKIFAQTSLYAAQASLQALRNTDLRPVLSQINIPVAICHGLHDQVCNYAFATQLHAGISSSQLFTFEHSGHALFLEETARFHEVVMGS